MWQRFLGWSWWVKGPTLAAVAAAVLIIVGIAGGGSSDDAASNESVVVAEPTDKPGESEPTPVPEATEIPQPTATSEPPPTTTPVPGPVTTFGDGTYIVGVDIQPGTYRNEGAGSCYWERLSGFGGAIDDIISNDNNDAIAIVTIATSDAGFSASRCGTWTRIGN